MSTAVKITFAPSLVLLTLLFGTPVIVPGQEATALASLPDAPLPQNTSAATAPPSPQNSSSSNPQSSANQNSKPVQTDVTPTQQKSSEDELNAEKKQRMLGIMPAFNSVESGHAKPLRPGQKFDLWFHSAIDPFTFVAAGLDAGIEQAENSYPEYHQGIEGYAKRYGAAYADNVDGNFWGNAVLPVLLHQDPRYFRLGQGPKKYRLWYAVISTVRCKGDNGKWQPSYSNVGGNLIGGAISNLYYPASDRGVGLTLERGFTVTAEGAFGSIAFEFYPDLIAYIQRRRQHKLPVVPPPAATTPVTPSPATPQH